MVILKNVKVKSKAESSSELLVIGRFKKSNIKSSISFLSNEDKNRISIAKKARKYGEDWSREFNKKINTELIDLKLEKIELKLEQLLRENKNQHLDKQRQELIDIKQEIKLQMRWSFGVMITVGALVVGVLRLT